LGHIKKLLAGGKIEPRYLTATRIWGDLCENIHLHFRNLRLDFNKREWAKFRAAVHNIGMSMEHGMQEYDWDEGDPNFLVTHAFKETLDPNSEYFTNRVSIEWQKDNTVHFHYRDIRLHWTVTEFEAILSMFNLARHKFTAYKPFPYHNVKEPEEHLVPIDMVQPYDAGHLPMAEDDEHRAGIEYCKRKIIDGERPRPILVDTTGQRKDGFKRYMAQLELGMDTISVIVDPNAKEGGQNNQSMFIEVNK